ncbi:hypothetical protein AV530_016769 [Patagioenas fasciata monilis]|uniref:Uncharacterized protein n=1 Tax=Patagioenas fasciata monilis TaxID=372326 RepID=A0A1V4J3I8_PATFA|nr:hypothetical protein AV530_016769 [Patagioenas fasciata monilis]
MLHKKNDYIPTAVFKVLESESGIGNELQFSDPLWPEQWELMIKIQDNELKYTRSNSLQKRRRDVNFHAHANRRNRKKHNLPSSLNWCKKA